MNDTNARLKQLIAELFKCDVGEVTDDTGPGDLPGWDSLGHVTLMTEIQRRFDRHVPIEEAIEVESVRDLAQILERLQGTHP
jgi:acyl carrier protein